MYLEKVQEIRIDEINENRIHNDDNDEIVSEINVKE